MNFVNENSGNSESKLLHWLALPAVLAGVLWAGKHLLQKECRQGRSFGSLLLKLSLHTGHTSIRAIIIIILTLPWSSSSRLLSASFSTTITTSSDSIFSLPSILLFQEDHLRFASVTAAVLQSALWFHKHLTKSNLHNAEDMQNTENPVHLLARYQ